MLYLVGVSWEWCSVVSFVTMVAFEVYSLALVFVCWFCWFWLVVFWFVFGWFVVGLGCGLVLMLVLEVNL